jgi:Ulp1 family protease
MDTLELKGGLKRYMYVIKFDLFTLDKVIIPIHMPNHWTCAVINIKRKRFEYYDSLGGSNSACLKVDQYDIAITGISLCRVIR